MNKIPGDIIILHMCTKNYDHMMYGSWDMMCDRWRDRLTDKLELGKKPWERGWYSLRPWKENTCLHFLGWTWLYKKFSYQSVEKKKKKKNLRAQLCSGHHAFHNSVSLTRIQLPVLNSRVLYQASLSYIKFSDWCHSTRKLS